MSIGVDIEESCVIMSMWIVVNMMGLVGIVVVSFMHRCMMSIMMSYGVWKTVCGMICIFYR